ncbi:MAG: lysophospholipase [Congregibacter sp.]
MSEAQLVPEERTLDTGIFYRRWAIGAPRAAVLLVHGLGEHSGRYQHVADKLATRGLECWAPDHPGHGRSPGHRCHIDAFDEYFAALNALRDEIGVAHPGLPCFIVGHSLGGLIVGNYLLTQQQQFSGAAFSAAAFEAPEAPSATAMFINKLIASVLPRLGVLQLDASQVSRDAAVVSRYLEDPLVHDGKSSARLVVELFAAMETLRRRRGEISLPTLIMHGEGDVMTAPMGSQHFFDGIGSSDKTLRLYPGLYHEIFNEPERAQVLGELCDWVNAHLSGDG